MIQGNRVSHGLDTVVELTHTLSVHDMHLELASLGRPVRIGGSDLMIASTMARAYRSWDS